MMKLLAIAVGVVTLAVASSTATPGDRAGCTEDEFRSANVCIHVEGDGWRYLGR